MLLNLALVLALPLAAVCQGDPTKPASEPIYHVGAGVKGPRPIYQPGPGVPKDFKARQRGRVVLLLVVGSDGLPREIKVDRPLNAESDEEAMKAVARWKFDPATRDGKPVAVQINVVLEFHYR